MRETHHHQAFSNIPVCRLLMGHSTTDQPRVYTTTFFILLKLGLKSSFVPRRRFWYRQARKNNGSWDLASDNFARSRCRATFEFFYLKIYQIPIMRWKACHRDLYNGPGSILGCSDFGLLTRAWQGYFYNATDRRGVLFASPLRTQELLVGFTKFKRISIRASSKDISLDGHIYLPAELTSNFQNHQSESAPS